MHRSNRRRVLAATSALVVVGALAVACSDEPAGNGPLPFADKRVGAMDNYERGVQFRATTSEPLTFSLLIQNHPNYPLNKEWIFWQWLEERTNVKFELIEAPLSDFNTRRATLINAGDAPQIISRFYDGEGEFVASGSLLPVSDYIDLLPNFKWRVENWNMANDLLTRTQADGKYYVLPGLHEKPNIDYTFAARTDLLKKYNIEPPTTLDGFRSMLETLKQECAGVATCYPMSDLFNQAPPDRPAGNLLRYIGQANGVRAGWDYQPVTWNYNTQAYEVTATSAGYKATIEYLHDLVADGLLDPESFTQTDEQAQQKLAQGRSFVISTNSQNIVNTYRPNLPEGATIAKLPIPTGPAGNVIAGWGGRLENGIAFRADVVEDENFVALMQFADWLWYSEEGQEFTKWGKVGETYSKDASGKRTLNSDITMLGHNPGAPKQLQVDFGVYQGTFVYGGTRELMTSYFTDEELAFQATLEGRTVNPLPPPAPFDEIENVEATLIATDLNTHVMSNTLEFILGTRPLSEWNAFVSEVEQLDANRYLEMVNTAKDRLAATVG